jgi:hypothetical protein
MLVFTAINKDGFKSKIAVTEVLEVNQLGDGSSWVKYPDRNSGSRSVRVADKFGQIMKKVHNANRG